MPTKAKRAKFRVGQVVAFVNERPYRTMLFGKIRVVSNGPDFIYNVDGRAEAEQFLRSLTRREAGNGRKG